MMMALASERRRHVQLMLNTLEGERHVQRPLLRELIEVAAGDPEFGAALSAARELLGAIDRGIDGGEFDRRVQLIAAQLSLPRASHS